MPIFTAQFFMPVDHRQHLDEQAQLAQLLQTIYHEPACDYNIPSDFSQCHQQLLALLDYIYALNPVNLALFALFRANIATLSPSSSPETMCYVLKNTKRSLEISLPAIKKHHADINTEKLNGLTVDLCYAGACSNIEQALSYFHKGGLAFYIEHAKAEFLMQLTQDFLRHHHLIDYPGNEIHAANFLYNQCAEDYGLTIKHDPLTSSFHQLIINRYIHFIHKHFTVPRFVQYCCTCFPNPPNLLIADNQSFAMLNDFFALFHESNSRDHYLYLYEEHYDNLDICLKPKADFHSHFACLLLHFFEKNQYIKKLRFCIDDKNYVYTGQHIVALSADYGSQLLSPKELISLADYVFTHPHYSLTSEQIIALIYHLPDSNTEHYISCLMQADNRLYFRELLSIKRHLFQYIETWLPHLALKYDANCIILLLNRSNINLQFPNSKGLMPAHYAAYYGKISAIDTLYALNADLNIRDINGLTMAHYAAIKGNIAVLYKLYELGISLNKIDDHGRTPADYARHYGREIMLEKLLSLGIKLKTSSNPLINTQHTVTERPFLSNMVFNVLSIFTFFKSPNHQSHSASQHKDSAIFP